jgi:hypothetical protein
MEWKYPEVGSLWAWLDRFHKLVTRTLSLAFSHHFPFCWCHWYTRAPYIVILDSSGFTRSLISTTVCLRQTQFIYSVPMCLWISSFFTFKCILLCWISHLLTLINFHHLKSRGYGELHVNATKSLTLLVSHDHFWTNCHLSEDMLLWSTWVMCSFLMLQVRFV